VTDFPVELARMNLFEVPNSLYSKKLEVGAVERGTGMPSSSSFAGLDGHTNRQYRSSSSGPMVDQFNLHETMSSDRSCREIMHGTDTSGQTVSNTEFDTSCSKTSFPPPVRLWSCLINPSDKYTSVSKEKNMAAVSASTKSSNRDKKLGSVTSSRVKSMNASNIVDSRGSSDVRQTSSKPRLLTPSRDRAYNKNSGSASDPASNSDKKQLKSRIYGEGDNRNLTRNVQNVSVTSKKVTGEKKHITNRQSRATSQGRPDEVSLENKDTDSLEQAPNSAFTSIAASQPENGKRKRRKKKSAASSDVVIVPDSVVPLHPFITPHLDDFGEFPSLPVTDSRVDESWDVSRRYRSTSSVSQVSALSDECNNIVSTNNSC